MFEPNNNKVLFQQVAEGDERAFAALFNIFLPKLHPFIIKLTQSETATQDIIQETFIKIWLNRDTLANMHNPGGWIYRVASNKCYDYLRARAVNEKLFHSLAPDYAPAYHQHTPLDVKELKRLVSDAIDKLPEQRQKIYRMSREEAKTIPEIASVLQISPNTVKNSLVTALKFIREYLVRHGIDQKIFLFAIVLVPA